MFPRTRPCPGVWERIWDARMLTNGSVFQRCNHRPSQSCARISLEECAKLTGLRIRVSSSLKATGRMPFCQGGRQNRERACRMIQSGRSEEQTFGWEPARTGFRSLQNALTCPGVLGGLSPLFSGRNASAFWRKGIRTLSCSPPQLRSRRQTHGLPMNCNRMGGDIRRGTKAFRGSAGRSDDPARPAPGRIPGHPLADVNLLFDRFWLPEI